MKIMFSTARFFALFWLLNVGWCLKDTARVYVYDLPEKFNYEPYDTVACDWHVRGFDHFFDGLGSPVTFRTDQQSLRNNDQYTMEIVMHQRMLTYENRVYNRSEADLIYVPFYFAYTFHTLILEGLTKKEQEVFLYVRMLELLDYLRAAEGVQEHEWSKHFVGLGREEGMFFGGRFNLFEKEGMAPFLDMIRIHYRQDCRKDFAKPWKYDQTCDLEHNFRVVLAPQVATVHATRGEPLPWLSEHDRPHLATFVGNNRRHRGPIVEQVRECFECTLEMSDDPQIPDAPTIEQVITAYSTADFCLHPWGDGPLRRGIYDSIALGCIPVFFVKARKPWDTFIDYDKFSITLEADQQDEIIKTLERIPMRKRKMLRENLREYAQFFQWSFGTPPVRDAFDAMMVEITYVNLRRNAKKLEEKVYCRRCLNFVEANKGVVLPEEYELAIPVPEFRELDSSCENDRALELKETGKRMLEMNPKQRKKRISQPFSFELLQVLAASGEDCAIMITDNGDADGDPDNNEYMNVAGLYEQTEKVNRRRAYMRSGDPELYLFYVKDIEIGELLFSGWVIEYSTSGQFQEWDYRAFQDARESQVDGEGIWFVHDKDGGMHASDFRQVDFEFMCEGETMAPTEAPTQNPNHVEELCNVCVNAVGEYPAGLRDVRGCYDVSATAPNFEGRRRLEQRGVTGEDRLDLYFRALYDKRGNRLTGWIFQTDPNNADSNKNPPFEGGYIVSEAMYPQLESHSEWLIYTGADNEYESVALDIACDDSVTPPPEVAGDCQTIEVTFPGELDQVNASGEYELLLDGDGEPRIVNEHLSYKYEVGEQKWFISYIEEFGGGWIIQDRHPETGIWWPAKAGYMLNDAVSPLDLDGETWWIYRSSFGSGEKRNIPGGSDGSSYVEGEISLVCIAS